ncbi:MAG: phage antirepressor KilAC domain-containing protein [Clostridia bacterium]|nr:phage antirepressor KilAC domain-containing protein [Clostridia bacterium]
MIDNEPWFVLKDVCVVLEMGANRAGEIVKRLEKDEYDSIGLTDSLGREQNAYIINESGLYSVILRSDKPQAKPFRKWVTSEVLPDIRKHGAYMTANTLEQALLSPDYLIRLATALKNEQEQRKLLEEKNEQQRSKIEEDKPKVIFAETVETAKTSILVGELAKILKQNGVATGQKRFFEWLRSNGYLIKSGSDKNMPTQRSMELGLFEIKETAIAHSDGHTTVQKTPKVTGKGQQYFIHCSQLKDLFLSTQDVGFI